MHENRLCPDFQPVTKPLMRLSTWFFLLLFTLCATVCVCETTEPLATFSGNAVTEAMFQDFLRELPPMSQAPPPGMSESAWKSATLRELCSSLLAAEAATSEGLDKSKDYLDQLGAFEKEVLEYLLFDREVDSRVSLTNKDLAAYRREHPSEFMEPRKYYARPLYLKDVHKAGLVTAALREGKSFQEVEKRFSDLKASEQNRTPEPLDPNGVRRLFPKEVADLILESTGPRTLPVVKVANGYFVAKIETVTEERKEPPGAGLPEVAARLKASQRRRLYSEIEQRAQSEIPASVDKQAADNEATTAGAVVATIAGKTYTKGEFDEAYRQRAPVGTMRVGSRGEFVSQFVSDRQRLELAKRIGLTTSPEYVQRLKWFRTNRLATLWLDEQVKKNYRAGGNDARAYYDSHPWEFVEKRGDKKPLPFERVKDLAAKKAELSGAAAVRSKLKAELLRTSGFADYQSAFFSPKTITAFEAVGRAKNVLGTSSSVVLVQQLDKSDTTSPRDWGRSSRWLVVATDRGHGEQVVVRSSSSDEVVTTDVASLQPIPERYWMLDSPMAAKIAFEAVGRQFIRQFGPGTFRISIGQVSPELAPNEYLMSLDSEQGPVLRVAVDANTGDARRLWSMEPENQ